MRTLNVYLWKEWREHRVTLAGLALALPCLVALAAWLVPRKTLFADPIVLNGSIALAVLAVALAVGGELLAGDTRGTRLRFLERVPSGLSQAFGAKLLFYLAALVIAGAYGWLLSAVASYVRVGMIPEFRPAYALVLLPAVAVALWTFAVASWVPRGSLSLPTGILLMAALGWPFGLYFAVRTIYRLQEWELVSLFALFVAGALVAARLSFVRGRRFDRPAWQAALLGIGTAVLFVLPIWGWTGARLLTARRIDPRAPGFTIGRAVLCSQREHAFLNAWQHRDWLAEPPSHALVVDLESGAWTREAEAECREVQRRREELPAGLGDWRFRDRTYYDPFRQRVFDSEDVLPDNRGRRHFRVLIGPGPWLLYSWDPYGWLRFDPETGEHDELDWPAGGLSTPPMLADGRVFLLRDGFPVLGAPRDGSLESVACDAPMEGIRAANSEYEALRAAGLVLLTDGRRVYRFEDMRLVPIEVDRPRDYIFAASGEDRVLLVDTTAARIVRMNVRSGRRDVLFPRFEQ